MSKLEKLHFSALRVKNFPTFSRYILSALSKMHSTSPLEIFRILEKGKTMSKQIPKKKKQHTGEKIFVV